MKMDPALHQDKKPSWIKVRLPNNPVFWSTKSLITDLKLVTVCEEAQCPNRWECWGQGTATFMIAGEKCTRACGFCAVKTAKPDALEADEPIRVAEATRRMKLRHVVITAVARDDLRDGGAEHFQQTIEAVRAMNPGIVIEVLVPDFNDRDWALQMVMDARPHIFNHNLETVERLTPLVRSRAKYHRSLAVLKKAKAMVAGKVATKSGIMLGLGETRDEILRAMDDLLESDVTVLTMGQYLRPTPRHLPESHISSTSSPAASSFALASATSGTRSAIVAGGSGSNSYSCVCGVITARVTLPASYSIQSSSGEFGFFRRPRTSP